MKRLPPALCLLLAVVRCAARIPVLPLLFLVALCGLAAPAGAQDLTATNDGAAAPDISILTFGPGQLYWERFGHNAILVRQGDDAVAYNYGIFDFTEENFFLNFARGHMTYRMGADSLYSDLRLYEYEGRWVIRQHLDLTAPQRIALRDFLEWNARPENTHYRYDYFTSNCSTRVRDALDRALGGALRPQLERRMSTATYRSDAVRLISPDLWWALGMDSALGPSADHTMNLWQQSFVPMALMAALRDVRITDADGREHLLVDDERQLRAARLPDPPAAAPDWRVPFGAGSVLLAIALLFLSYPRRSRAAHIVFSILAGSIALACGVGGLILAAIWGVTDHWAGWRNENLLLFDPLCLLLVPGWFTWFRHGGLSPFARSICFLTALLALAAPALKFFPSLEQANQAWICLLLPLHLIFAWIAWRAPAR
jgi:hypothetical protein